MSAIRNTFEYIDISIGSSYEDNVKNSCESITRTLNVGSYKKLGEEAGIVDLGVKTFLGLGIFPERLKNYTARGNGIFQHWYVKGQFFPGVPIDPKIMWNNFHDRHDYSVRKIEERESL